MSQENVELIRGVYEEFDDTRRAVLRVLDPEVEWHTAPDLPDSGVHRGHDGVASLIEEWVSSFDDLRAEVDEFIDAGERVVVPLVLRARMRGSGQEIALPETHVWTVRAGKVIEVREYRTRGQALKDVGLEG